jgi:hypothetical protein
MGNRQLYGMVAGPGHVRLSRKRLRARTLAQRREPLREEKNDDTLSAVIETGAHLVPERPSRQPDPDPLLPSGCVALSSTWWYIIWWHVLWTASSGRARRTGPTSLRNPRQSSATPRRWVPIKLPCSIQHARRTWEKSWRGIFCFKKKNSILGSCITKRRFQLITVVCHILLDWWSSSICTDQPDLLLLSGDRGCCLYGPRVTQSPQCQLSTADADPCALCITNAVFRKTRYSIYFDCAVAYPTARASSTAGVWRNIDSEKSTCPANPITHLVPLVKNSSTHTPKPY